MGVFTPPSHHMEGSKIIKAKFKSYCPLTGEVINVGDECLYDTTYGRVYAKGSSYHRNFLTHINKQK
jgi:hypothetical protein